MEELYDVRSKVVHKGDHSGRSWGWQIGEHLVMAAHVFPLTVKLMLEKEGRYEPTDEDRAACLATDLLLVETQWVEDRDGRNTGHSWHEVISKAESNLRFDKIWEKYKREHPEVFQEERAEPSDRRESVADPEGD